MQQKMMHSTYDIKMGHFKFKTGQHWYVHHLYDNMKFIYTIIIH